jgi:TetR/AcrR family transcriptional regulator
MDTKERLLDEALRLFARRGVDAVGVQEVVDAAGVTKPSLYHHFGSKDGLVQALVDRGFATLNRALDALGPYDRDLPWYLERQAGIWIDTVRFQPDWFRVELSLTFLSDDNPAAALVRPGVTGLQTRMESLFTEAGAQHGNMRGRHRLLAAGWIGALNHWTGIHLGGWAEPDEAFLRAGTRQFLYGIFS